MNELTHQPFNEWLLADEPLTVEQAQQLQDHLRACEKCRKQQLAWMGVQHLMRATGQLSPAPGFAFRWQVRFATRRLERQRRIAWWFFLVMSSLALILLSLLGWQVLTALAEPGQIQTGLWQFFSSLTTRLEHLWYLAGTILRIFPPVPVVGLMFFTGLVTMLSVLWVVVYRQLTMRRVPL
jgi:hypothetical protein